MKEKNNNSGKEILGIWIGENESSKFWLGVLNELKQRGVKDILIICSDNLTGIKEAIQTAFPNTVQQRCIVHMIRNSVKFISSKDSLQERILFYTKFLTLTNFYYYFYQQSNP